MEKYTNIIAEIKKKYRKMECDILYETTERLVHWPSPPHGYRKRDEFESDPRYRELVNTKHLISHGLVRPESDIRVEGGQLKVSNVWFYNLYFPDEMARLKAIFPEGDSSSGDRTTH